MASHHILTALFVGFAAAPVGASRMSLQNVQTMVDENVDSDSVNKAVSQVVANLATQSAVATNAAEQEPEVTAFNAGQPDFNMPAFDVFARVRSKRLIEAGVQKSIAEEVVKMLATGWWYHGSFVSSHAEKGIVQHVWDGGQIAPKLFAFGKYSAKNGRNRADGVMDFDEFVNTPSLNSTWINGLNAAADPPEKVSDYAAVAGWLADNFNYWRHFSGKTLAKAFVKQRCSFDKLVQFASLDQDQNAELSFAEAYQAMPTEPPAPQLEWSNVAVAEESDFKSLRFPSALAKSTVSLGKSGHAIESSEYTELNLQNTLNEFLKRDQRPSAEEAKEVVTGGLKFFQIADILPTDTEGGNVVANVNGHTETIHVPTFQELSGDKNGLLDLTAEEIEGWLQKEEQGMKNSWSFKFWTDKNKHAKNMAQDVLHWGDGSIPGVERNGRLQGPNTQNDQFTDVAPRLALFVHLDEDHDGMIDFAAAHPYLVKNL